MASSPAAGNPRLPTQVIDLTSDDSDSDGGAPVVEPPRPNRMDGFDDVVDFMDLVRASSLSPPPAPRPDGVNLATLMEEPARGGFYVEIDGQNVFIPDDPDDAVAGAAAIPPVEDANILRDHEIAMGLQQPEDPEQDFPLDEARRADDIARDRAIALALENQEITADTCLQRVLEIFPDISHDHVLKLYADFGNNEGQFEILPGQARLDNIIEQLADGRSYPKQEKGKLKRKREPSIDESDMKQWEKQDRAQLSHHLQPQMRSMLKAEFPIIPVQYINDTLKTNKHFFQAYVALTKAQDNSDSSARPFGRGRPSNTLTDAATIAMNTGSQPLLDELNAARTKVQSIKREKALEDAKQRAEKENLEKAIAAGETSDCSACFDDLPMNRQIHCNGPVAHFTCYDCALTYIKSEIGESRCRVLCTAGCGAAFANDQLNQLSDKQLLDKLYQLQQEKDIREAGLDNLEECPFCDYKEILPPIEEDFEFRCKNPNCEEVSCRRCKAVSHIPISCEEHAKDCKGSSRKKIEEAMTAAMIRSCNQCKKQFIKDFGCNKMRCPSCGNLQCYVCSTSIKDYNHFDQSPAGAAQNGTGKTKCPLYDNVEERHEREVKEAEAAARADVLRENPDLTEEDLQIRVSDAVQKADKERIRRAGPPGGRFAGFGPAFLEEEAELMNEVLGAGFQAQVADRVRGLHARQQVAQARRAARNAAAREDLYGLRAQQQQIQARLEALQAGVPEPGQHHHHPAQHQAQQPGGLLGAVRGYIPVLFDAAAVAPAPQANQQQEQQAQPQAGGRFGGRQGRFGGFNPFNFGGDGAADLDLPRPNQAPPNNNGPVNNPAIDDWLAALPPGAYPPPAREDRVNDFQQQLRDLELQNLRRQEERRVLEQQRAARAQQMAAVRARINNPPPNRHYEEFEHMRRMGNQQW